MSTETEIKIKVESVENFCRKLAELKPERLSSRHFEDNHLLDFPDGRIGSSKCLLRVRFDKGHHLVTYKGPPREEGIFKVREELETKVEDGAILLQAFDRIGMCVRFRYQKYRQEYSVDGVHVAVDETPIGNYAEFEGSEDAIRDLASKMHIDESEFLRSSYYSLYLEYCREKGAVPGFMIF